jgi:Restriction endonuclease EcoRV
MEFAQKLKERRCTFEVKGLLTGDDKILTLGSDTKVLSTIFELFTYPLVKEVAAKHGLTVETPEAQTVYPDFTLMTDKDDKAKIAVDVKTTYRRPNGFFFYTLGSYTSFLRNDTKNILYPYSTYAQHWIIGFVYSRINQAEAATHNLEDRSKIPCPYKDVQYFVQEKYKISGLRPGSGNTTNIGSIAAADIDDFEKGNGKFAPNREKYFREYWANYLNGNFKNLDEFENWKKANPNHLKF